MDISSLRSFRLCILVVSACVLLSAVGTGAVAMLQAKPAWFLLLFEIVVAAAGVFGLLIARGRFQNGPAIALASGAVCVGAASLLGFVGAGQAAGGVSLKGWFVARLLAATVFAMAAGGILIARSGKPALRSLAVGMVLSAVFGALLVGAMAVRLEDVGGAAWRGARRDCACGRGGVAGGVLRRGALGDPGVLARRAASGGASRFVNGSCRTRSRRD